mgnify:CR=1 FL=1
MNFDDAIKILELKSNHPTADEIKSAFRILAKRYHPDLTGNMDTSNFIRVETAYKFLMNHLAEIGHFSQKEKEDIESFHTKIFFDEFILVISQLHNDYIVLPRALNETVKANEFFNLLDNLFSDKVIESLRVINNIQKKKELINLLSTVTAGHTLKFRRNFFKKIKPIANGDRLLEKMMTSTIYGVPSQILSAFSDTDINKEPDEKDEAKETSNKNQKFVYSSEKVKDFLKSFNEHQNKPRAKDDYYNQPDKTFRESYKEEKDKEAGKLLFKKLKYHIKSNNISDLRINLNEVEAICQLLGIISNLSKYVLGVFIKELSNDLGFEPVLYRLVVEEKLSSKDFRVLLEFFRYYLPNRNKFPELINPSLKYNDYASIFNEMFFVYQIALHTKHRFNIV